MIKYTTEEMLIYQKVKLSYHQQDLIDFLKDLKKDKDKIKQYEKRKDVLERLGKEIQDLENLIARIEAINTPEEFTPYERYVESAYWDSEVLQNACELLLNAYQTKQL